MTDSTIERAPDPAADGPAASAEAAGVPAGEPPDHIPLRGVVAALLGIMGVGAVVLGGHDTFAGGDVPVRLVGTIVLVAGIFFVVAAAALLADWREDRLLASMACVWGFLLATLILLSQLTNGEPSGTLAIWVAAMVLCATSFLMVRRSASAADRQRFIKALPAAGSVVSVGVLISLAQFYYTTIYLPASAPPSLNVTIKLEPAGRQGDRMVLHGEVTVTNISNTRATVLTSDVSVLGMNGDATPFKYFTESLPGVPQGSPLAAQRYWGEAYGAVIVAATADVIEMKAGRPPGTREGAVKLAREQFAYCTDIVTQGTETIENLAAGLLGGTAWYFWWD